MKRIMCAVLIAGLTFSLFAGAARAHEDEGEEAHETHEMSAAKLRDKLGLSDDQVTKLNAAWKSGRDAAKPYRDQMKADLAKLTQQAKMVLHMHHRMEKMRKKWHEGREGKEGEKAQPAQ